jgi:hypothetical protein
VLKVLYAIVGLVAALGAVRAWAAPEPAANRITLTERKAGFRLLFDGKTTRGWRGYRKKGVPAGWKVVGGALALVEKGAGDLVTTDSFDNFELLIDWRIAEGGNSGVIYRVAESDLAPYFTGPEYQVLDDERHPDANKGAAGTRKAGSLYDLHPVEKRVVHPAGQWNHARIVADGKHVEHWLNGVKVVDAVIDSPDWIDRLARSKWKDAKRFAKEERGLIDLQDHGDKVEYRNIKIRVLDRSPPGDRRALAPPPG